MHERSNDQFSKKKCGVRIKLKEKAAQSAAGPPRRAGWLRHYCHGRDMLHIHRNPHTQSCDPNDFTIPDCHLLGRKLKDVRILRGDLKHSNTIIMSHNFMCRPSRVISNEPWAMQLASINSRTRTDRPKSKNLQSNGWTEMISHSHHSCSLSERLEMSHWLLQ